MTYNQRTTCSVCGIRQHDRGFRDPTLDPICRDCEVRGLNALSASNEVRRLGADERAALERDEQDFRKRAKEGDLSWYGTEEYHERIARRAALLGVPASRYRLAEDGAGREQMLWLPIYVVSALLVGIVAVWRGLSTSPPELLAPTITILLLVGTVLFIVWLFDRDAYRELELRASLYDRAGCIYYLVFFLSALVLPVLAYGLVLFAVP